MDLMIMAQYTHAKTSHDNQNIKMLSWDCIIICRVILETYSLTQPQLSNRLQWQHKGDIIFDGYQVCMSYSQSVVL